MSSSEIPDLEDIVKKWAMDIFEYTKSKDQSKIPKDSLVFTVDWKRVRFKHHPPQYTEAEKPPKPKAQVLFKTFFSNNTDMDQEYSFKTERSTCSICEVQIEKGVTVGQELSINLKTPCEVFEANAGFKREVSLTKSQGETIEEELAWEVDSQIKVPPRTRTTAELVITEDQYCGLFHVVSEMSGQVNVSITNIRDNNSFVKSVQGDMDTIIRREVENGSKAFTIKRKDVSFETTGKCNFRYAVEQHVVLGQHPLGDD